MLKDQLQPNNELLQGNALQIAAQTNIVEGVRQTTETDSPVAKGFLTAIEDNFEELVPHVDWQTPRSTGELRTFAFSTLAALQYAQLKTGESINYYDLVTDSEEWREIIQGVISKAESRKIFSANVWRSPMVVSPGRGAVLQSILPHMFGDKAIVGADLGSGLHVALPLLNFSPYMHSPGLHNPAPVNIALGLGVDKQNRDLTWAQASYWPAAGASKGREKLALLYRHASTLENTFPFLQADVFKTQAITREVRERTSRNGLDFVFTSFMRHQLGHDPLIQARFFNTVDQLLDDEGILVDIGKEHIGQNPASYDRFSVDVYQKHRGALTYLGSPYTFGKRQHEVVDVAWDFFSSNNPFQTIGTH